MPEILPPSSDEVKFNSVSLKMSPLAHSKLQARIEATGLTKAKIFNTLLETAYAALDGNTAQLGKWQQYYAQVVAAKKTGA